ncbi:MAG: hypothetical protein J2P19_30010, partial [Pseudonocardia sp.]|nr:hypothetical protein [Pseudonocardia sp.]
MERSPNVSAAQPPFSEVPGCTGTEADNDQAGRIRGIQVVIGGTRDGRVRPRHASATTTLDTSWPPVPDEDEAASTTVDAVLAAR